MSCYHYKINGGYCRQCTDNSDDLDNIYCNCYDSYCKTDSHTCTRCPNGCQYCTYDQNLAKVNCTECYSNYTMNSQGTCTYCGKGCSFCSLDENDKPICLYCYRGYDLIDGKCYDCPSDCEECYFDETSNDAACRKMQR